MDRRFESGRRSPIVIDERPFQKSSPFADSRPWRHLGKNPV